MSYQKLEIVILLAVLLNIATVTSFSSTININSNINNNYHHHHATRLLSTATAMEPEVKVVIEKPNWIAQELEMKTIHSSSTISSSSSLSQSSTNTAVMSTKKGGISMTMEELSEVLGDTNRAQLVWDCYSIGVDPTKIYGNMVDLGYDDFESINESLPKTSRCCLALEDSLGPKGMQSLANCYPISSKGKIENGVAELVTFRNTGEQQLTHNTKKMVLKLADGEKVETFLVTSSSTTNGISSTSTLMINSRAIVDDNSSSSSSSSSGGGGSGRSLSSDEILSQMFYGRKMCRWESLPQIADVIVYMGQQNNNDHDDAADHAEAVLIATKILKSSDTFLLRDESKVQLSMGLFDPSL